MKKIYLLAFSFVFMSSGFAQNNPFRMDKDKMRVEKMITKENQPRTKPIVKPLPEIPTPDRDVNIVSIVDIGTSGNAYTYWRKLSYLWVDPDLNSIVNIHYMGGSLDPGGSTGDLGYDISSDGGQSWNTMIEVFLGFQTDNCWVSAKYPQCGIVNPTGSSNPNDAFVAYFAPATDSSCQKWVYANGVGAIADTSYQTQSFLYADDQIYINVPADFHISSEGIAFAIDENRIWTNEPLYLDEIIITKGEWNENKGDYIYSTETLEAVMDTSAGGPADLKIAFGPDGQTGFIVAIGNNWMAEQIEGFNSLYPIYWKTENGGVTWSEPGIIQMDGPNGIGSIVNNLLTDEQLQELFGTTPPPRDEISYTTAFDCDIAVDAWDNLHIAVVVGLTGYDPFSIITAESFFACMDIYTNNAEETWYAEEMGRPKTFRGVFDDTFSDNRIQITTNPTYEKMFITWLDTDLEEEDENVRPNIWSRGFDPITLCKTSGAPILDGPTNVTLFSEGMWQAYFGTAPNMCFEFQNGEYTIPFTFIEFEPDDILSDVQIKYIQDFMFTDNDFYDLCLDEIQEQHEELFTVSYNIPNPFREETNIQIELYQSENIKVTVYSITGQYLFEKDFGRLNQGSHELPLQLSGLSPGVYFYTVTAGQNRITKKMVVE